MTFSTVVSGWLYCSVQYSVHLLILASSSVRKLPFLYWNVLTFAFLSVVRSLATLKAYLLSFSISEKMLFIQNYLTSCMAYFSMYQNVRLFLVHFFELCTGLLQ